MSSEPVISLKKLAKCYQIYDKPRDRLLQMLVRGRKQYYREFWALQNLNLEVDPGEVVGVIGLNGSGKSTLLQLVCGTLAATQGDIKIKGRIAALLELGSGFNPDFTGRENVYLSATLSGLSDAEIKASFEDIVDFSGIREFIDQPVKTYSSGMYVRLAFSVAINVDPDILIIDEALSVGDGEFSRRSFDRIMELKDSGTTILFCSHALYQVEALCTQVIWLDRGRVRKQGETADVISAYSDFLNTSTVEKVSDGLSNSEPHSSVPSESRPEISIAHIISTKLMVNGRYPLEPVKVLSRHDEVSVKIRFNSDITYSVPSIGVVFTDSHGTNITSAGSHIDNFNINRNPDGVSEVVVVFPLFPLLKGAYSVDIFLLCEKGIHVYDYALSVAKLTVKQADIEQGIVSIPHVWHCNDWTAECR